ncbi:hypothetical protein N9D23_09075 [Rubripirellula sp.]|jgi:hypothetical protein|nr:hypothetical protein [Rubripirellula sp.]
MLPVKYITTIGAATDQVATDEARAVVTQENCIAKASYFQPCWASWTPP